MIARIVFGQDMRLGIPGLTQYVEDNKIRIKPSEILLFMNTKKTMVKCFFGGQYLLTVKARSGKITIEELYRIPTYFSGTFITSYERNKLEKHLDVVAERVAS